MIFYSFMWIAASGLLLIVLVLAGSEGAFPSLREARIDRSSSLTDYYSRAHLERLLSAAREILPSSHSDMILRTLLPAIRKRTHGDGKEG